MAGKTRVSRRELIGGAAGLAIPAIIPASVLAKSGRPGANDRIGIASIGVGGMGRNHVPPDTAALCDVDSTRTADVADKVMKSFLFTNTAPPELYTDFRRILDRKDVDAVTIGTPDHWHAIMTVM